MAYRENTSGTEYMYMHNTPIVYQHRDLHHVMIKRKAA